MRARAAAQAEAQAERRLSKQEEAKQQEEELLPLLPLLPLLLLIRGVKGTLTRENSIRRIRLHRAKAVPAALPQLWVRRPLLRRGRRVVPKV